MNFFLGIDGGGTKTACVVGDEARVLGTGKSGGSSISRQGAEAVRASLHAAILQACEAAGIKPSPIHSTCIGVTGASSPDVRDAMRRFIAEIVPGPVMVLGDHEIAWEAAFAGAAGVVIVSGTGSIAFGRNELGETARAGGHGPATSDEGSGEWIGRAAVAERAVPLELLPTPEADLASLFPLIVRSAADDGGKISLGVLRRAGRKLARLAGMVIDKLWAAESVVPVALAGGVFEHSATVRESFAENLRRIHPGAQVNESIVDPVLGALSFARKNA